jgi:hypothetical protein
MRSLAMLCLASAGCSLIVDAGSVAEDGEDPDVAPPLANTDVDDDFDRVELGDDWFPSTQHSAFSIKSGQLYMSTNTPSGDTYEETLWATRSTGGTDHWLCFEFVGSGGLYLELGPVLRGSGSGEGHYLGPQIGTQAGFMPTLYSFEGLHVEGAGSACAEPATLDLGMWVCAGISGTGDERVATLWLLPGEPDRELATVPPTCSGPDPRPSTTS